MWGTLLADAVIQMLGTDYARILRAIYAFAQVKMATCFPIIEIKWELLLYLTFLMCTLHNCSPTILFICKDEIALQNPTKFILQHLYAFHTPY